MRRGDWIQTYTGKAFYPLDPLVDDIEIEDIAHALSNLCRYGGHSRFFYSVAEHSIHVSNAVAPELALQALLHDATEAYLVDVPRPIKPYLEGYSQIEDALWRVIAEKFNVPAELHSAVKLADVAVLMAEKPMVLGPSPGPWGFDDVRPADVRLLGFSPGAAKYAFLQRFQELTHELV